VCCVTWLPVGLVLRTSSGVFCRTRVVIIVTAADVRAEVDKRRVLSQSLRANGTLNPLRPNPLDCLRLTERARPMIIALSHCLRKAALCR